MITFVAISKMDAKTSVLFLNQGGSLLKTPQSGNLSVNKDLTKRVFYSAREKKNFKSFFMLMSSLIGIRKIALAGRGAPRLARRERAR